LIMRYFEKKSWDEIAEVLGCSIQKAKSDYDIAFQRLARRLGA
jgi:DNA-directed RNA polymerase specialized sigma24 family protein